MREIKQSATANVMVFMADSTDHITGKTALTLAVTISKDGAAFASISPTVTERGNGWYNVALVAADTGTTGDLVVRATATGADPGERTLNVVANVEADTYGRVGAAGAGLTAIGDTRIANLDAAVSSRLATAGYTAPDNTTIGFIQKWILNKLVEGPANTWKLYDDDDSTVLKTWTWDPATTTRSKAV